MAISPFVAAKQVCALGCWNVTNLQLHKILYLLQMVHLGRTNGQRLIDTDFEAWDYGPVIPDLYRRVKMFGSMPIHNIFFGVAPVDDPEEAAMMAEAHGHLSTMTPAKLVAVTHWARGAWAKHYKAGQRGIVIPDGDILDEYREWTHGQH